MKSFIDYLRYFFAFAVPLFLVASAVAEYYWPESVWPARCFAIFLASMVGYYTNFIAIKMLFRPQKPSIFGRQGLIPRKQPELANQLGKGISEHFFNAGELLQYLDEQQLLQKSAGRLKQQLDASLLDEQIQQKLSAWLAKHINNHTDEINQFLVKVADKNLTKMLAKETNLVKLAQQLGEYIESQIDNGEINLEQVVDKFAEIAAENIPDLAAWLHQQFEDYNENQGVIKRNFVSFLKWSSDIDEHALREQMFHLISTMEFRAGVYQFSERMVLSLTEYLSTEAGMVHVDNASSSLNQYLINRAREQGIPALIQRLESWLKSPEAWKAIDSVLSRTVDTLEVELNNYFHSESFKTNLEKWVPTLLEQFNVEQFIAQKVRTLDTARLEKLVLSATGEHLAAIEVLGGVLGGFAGIALFSLPTFGVLLGLLLGFLGVEDYLSSRATTNDESSKLT